MDTNDAKKETTAPKVASAPWEHYSVNAIANEIIRISQENEQALPVTNLRLQKLVYFAQGFALAMHNYPIFEEEIQAWTYGPVVPSLYDVAKEFGNEEISTIGSKDRVNPSDTLLLSFLKDFIAYFGSWTASELVESSHVENSPWDIAFKKAKFTKIELWRMLTYFKQYANTSN